MEPVRCAWVGTDELYCRYHDQEWGVPAFATGKLFEMLILEGAQAGLSWRTILHKREGYRAAFAGFDPARMAAFDDDDLARLLADPSIVRNRLKIAAAIDNARAVLRLEASGRSLSDVLWDHVGGKPVNNHWTRPSEVPVRTPTSNAMSKSLKAAGFRFVGPTICYAFMQAVGMVNDHTTNCFRHAELAGRR